MIKSVVVEVPIQAIDGEELTRDDKPVLVLRSAGESNHEVVIKMTDGEITVYVDDLNKALKNITNR